MLETVLEIDGMACGMCEAHINDCLRTHFSVKKVSSSHKKGKTVVLSEAPLEKERLEQVLAATGYTLRAVSQQTIEKSGGLFRRKGR